MRRTVKQFVPIVGLIMLSIIGGILWWRFGSPTRSALSSWLRDPDANQHLITTLTTPCPGAPFLLPSSGFVGFVYEDGTGPYTPINPHTGIDIFGYGEPGKIPVYAAYDGYLTRLANWKSAVIIRLPQDPLTPSRQIWTYYAHMASEDGNSSYISPEFPPDTHEKFVTQGTLLGYQGEYSGEQRQIALHLHFSIVLSEADGSFKNEAHFQNTIDPSPYLGFNVNSKKQLTLPVKCGA